MTPEKKKQLGHDLMAMVLMLAMLVTITRLWPILLLMILGLFGYALWSLTRVEKQPIIITPPQLQALPAPVTEQEVITVAFGLVQRRVNQQVTAIYPQARWVWSEPGARERFAAGGPLIILLNGAGGYQKALVQVSDLQLYSLTYLKKGAEDNAPSNREPDVSLQEEPEPPASIDYGLLAFEWVEANMQRLNSLANEAVAGGQTGFRIPSEELPHGDSWQTVCEELVRAGFSAAEAMADGIQVQIKSQKGA